MKLSGVHSWSRRRRILTVVVGTAVTFACIVGGFLAIAALSHACNRWSVPAGSIVFGSEYGSYYSNLHVVNSNGTDLRPLTNGPVYHRHPAWSPDGSRIAYAAGGGKAPTINMMNSDGTGLVPLDVGLNEVAFPTWSPDGSRIAFEACDETVGQDCGTPSSGSSIYVINADGTDLAALTRSGTDGHPHWSPDGSRIAFRSTRDGDPEIYVMNSDGTDSVRLTNNQVYDGHPAWSPDGSRIAFVQGDCRGSNWESDLILATPLCSLYVMNPDGTDQTRIYEKGSGNGRPAWSPDGSRIAFFAFKIKARGDVKLFGGGGISVDCSGDIYVIKADGTRLLPLRVPISEATCERDSHPSFDWSPLTPTPG